ncbi:MAG: ABC transporter ATP-binding protein [Clostridiales bacterium]|nr:ABC transporter ATP-binding protein [Clostridiales bacterium]
MKGIEVRSLDKNYGDVRALRNVSLTFEENKIYGLLGRNGAGKTTLLNTITGRIFPDSGDVLVDGEAALENDKAQQKTFMMSEKNFYPEGMKVKDAIKWTREFYPGFDEEYCRNLAEKFGLNTKKKIKSLSTGYGSIFKLILTLSTNAPYLFFDEPVLGLDANHRDMFYRALLEKYSDKPFTAVISTHLIEEVAGVIEEVVIIKKGEIIRNQSAEELLATGCTVSGTAAAVDSAIQGKTVLGVDSLGGLKTAYLAGEIDSSTLPAGIEIGKMDLQKLFIHLTNE